MKPVATEQPAADTPVIPNQPVEATVDGWTVQSASVNPPTKEQLTARMSEASETKAEEKPAVETPAKADEQVETPAAETPAEEVAAKPDAAAEAAKAPKPKPKRGSPEHRIEEMRFKQGEAERREQEARAENERLRLELDALKKPAEKKPDATSASPASGKPKPVWATMEAEGHSYDDFLDARDAWARDETLTAAKAEAAAIVEKQQADAREASNAEQQRRGKAAAIAHFGELLEAERKVTPNFDELIDTSLPVTPVMEKVFLTSPIGPKVMLYLNVNPDECRRIAGLDVATATYELGILEGQLRSEVAASAGPAKPASTTTNAKPPTRPVSGPARTGTTAAAPAASDFSADWVREENAREAELRRRRV